MSTKARKWSLRRMLRTIWVGAGVIFMLWMFYSMQAKQVDKKLFQSDEKIIAENKDDYYSFTPIDSYDNVLIFFPGALVQTKAYVPLCRKIAGGGTQVFLIKMPWRQATKGYNKPKELNMLSDSSFTYALAGHSQGGKMAAQFVYENPQLIDKLILIGTTHPRDISLAERAIPILKIYGSNDGVAPEAKIHQNKPMLPAHSQFVKIEGANHSQFGYYGFQLGDDKADISREQQQQETLKSILTFLKK